MFLCSSNSTAINEAQYSKKKNRLLIRVFLNSTKCIIEVCACMCMCFFVCRIYKDKTGFLTPRSVFRHIFKTGDICVLYVVGFHRRLGEFKWIFRFFLEVNHFSIFHHDPVAIWQYASPTVSALLSHRRALFACFYDYKLFVVPNFSFFKVLGLLFL